MPNIFINPLMGNALNYEREVCDFESWMTKRYADSVVCGLHESGVMVFTPLEKIETSDEYASGDPYKAAKELESGEQGGFHQGRIDCTLNLLEIYLSPIHSTDFRDFTLLDIGCGEGHITARIKKKFHTLETVYGLDMSISACVTGKKLYPELNFVVGSAYDLPFCKESFDVVIMNNIYGNTSLIRCECLKNLHVFSKQTVLL
jgi:SAM-dependent methyltransferase